MHGFARAVDASVGKDQRGERFFAGTVGAAACRIKAHERTHVALVGEREPGEIFEFGGRRGIRTLYTVRRLGRTFDGYRNGKTLAGEARGRTEVCASVRVRLNGFDYGAVCGQEFGGSACGRLTRCEVRGENVD